MRTNHQYSASIALNCGACDYTEIDIEPSRNKYVVIASAKRYVREHHHGRIDGNHSVIEIYMDGELIETMTYEIVDMAKRTWT